MANLATTYMGIPISSPIIVGACSLSNMVDRIKRAENAGAGALVVRSMFEEQIIAEQKAYEAGQYVIDPQHLKEAQTYFPSLDNDAARAHLMWIKKSKAAVDMPIIASLNAAKPGSWASFSKELVNTGADGIELNVYYVATNPGQTSSEVEESLFEIVGSVTSAVDVPVSVKLSPYYTSISYVVQRLAELGASSVVLFNRFLQPEIDPDELTLRSQVHFSHPDELRLPLRWTAILHGRVDIDISLSTGVHHGKDAAKALLAGANTVQVASTLYEHGIDYLNVMNSQLNDWMDAQGFETLADVRGKLSQKNVDDPFKFERSQYVKILLSER